MDVDTIKFISEIAKPWESLNQELGRAFSMNPNINDFITKAHAIAIAIKHYPESNRSLKVHDVAQKSKNYSIISDLADTIKHGKLRDQTRESRITLSSMFERNSAAKLRFLRNRITIVHNSQGKLDFMQASMDASTFIVRHLGLALDWTPAILDNDGEFSDTIQVHATKNNQIAWSGMTLEIVQRTDNGELENVDLNGTIRFELTSDF